MIDDFLLDSRYKLLYRQAHVAFYLAIFARVGVANTVFVYGICCGVHFEYSFPVGDNETLQNTIDRITATVNAAFSSQALLERDNIQREHEHFVRQ
jgi:hypothetical protein